jgi:hypothetical protein
MSARTAARLAWSLWVVTLAFIAGGLILGVASRPEAPLYGYWVEDTLIGPTFATLGALIVSRRPGNVIGWIFLVAGEGAGVQLLCGQYATVALHSETPPGGAVAAWLSTLAQTSIVFSALFLILLFPTGRLPSPRWRPVAWISGTVIVVSVVVTALTPGPIQDFPSAKLRDETDLNRLGGELVSVTRESVQPTHASLWLREPGRRAREKGSRYGDTGGGQTADLAAATSGGGPRTRGGRP